jgi:uncharacterized surface protein with fasciclin (FAS1) repeats
VNGRRAAGGWGPAGLAHGRGGGGWTTVLDRNKESVMKKFGGFAAMAVLAFTVVGCSDSMSPAAPTSAAPDSGISSGSDEAKGGRAALPTIADTAVAAGSFKTLVAALSKAGLVDTFKGSQQYTVFAPTDQAFDAAAAALLGPGKTGMDLVNALSVEKLTQVLVYHVAQGDRRAQGVVSSGQVQMLDGNFAPITSANGKFYIAGAEILATDIIASNGIIHAIGFVMVPPDFQL